MSVRIPTGTRWSCRSCAHCCKGHQLGPVEPAVIAGLVRRNVSADWPPAASGPWYHEQPGPNGPLAYLAQRQGQCVFLREDGLCAVHALYGADAKPGFCREFPYHLVEDPKGLVAIIRPECGGFHESFLDGEPVLAETALAHAALPRVVPRRRFAPAAVTVLPGRRVDLESWMILEEDVLEALGSTIEPETAAVARIREVLARRMGADLPTPRSEQFDAAAHATLNALAQVLALVANQEGGTPEQRAFFEASAARIRQSRAALAHPLPPLEAQAVAWRHLVLRGFVLAKQFTAMGEVPAGLGLFLLDGIVARATAEGPDAASLSAALTPWMRFRAIALVQQVLQRARPALEDLFLHAEG